MSEPRQRNSGERDEGRSANRGKALNDSTNDENRLDDGINYSLEGGSPPVNESDRDPTAAGYDEAAHSGPSRYGVPEGQGGVFGTSGGGTFSGGGQVIEPPGIYDRTGEPSHAEAQSDRHGRQRESERYDRVNTEEKRKPED